MDKQEIDNYMMMKCSEHAFNEKDSEYTYVDNKVFLESPNSCVNTISRNSDNLNEFFKSTLKADNNNSFHNYLVLNECNQFKVRNHQLFNNHTRRH